MRLKFESDFLEMLDLSRELGKLHELLNHHNDENDKRNYNKERCVEIKREIDRVTEVFSYLKNKWFE